MLLHAEPNVYVAFIWIGGTVIHDSGCGLYAFVARAKCGWKYGVCFVLRMLFHCIAFLNSLCCRWVRVIAFEFRALFPAFSMLYFCASHFPTFSFSLSFGYTYIGKHTVCQTPFDTHNRITVSRAYLLLQRYTYFLQNAQWKARALLFRSTASNNHWVVHWTAHVLISGWFSYTLRVYIHSHFWSFRCMLALCVRRGAGSSPWLSLSFAKCLCVCVSMDAFYLPTIWIFIYVYLSISWNAISPFISRISLFFVCLYLLMLY